jgi:hypothetical protein
MPFQLVRLFSSCATVPLKYIVFRAITYKKENKIYLIDKEIQSGAVAYIRNGVPIYIKKCANI